MSSSPKDAAAQSGQALTQYEIEGSRAYENGSAYERNPYPVNSPEGQEWSKGWSLAAEAHATKAQEILGYPQPWDAYGLPGE